MKRKPSLIAIFLLCGAVCSSLYFWHAIIDRNARVIHNPSIVFLLCIIEAICVWAASRMFKKMGKDRVAALAAVIGVVAIMSNLLFFVFMHMRVIPGFQEYARYRIQKEYHLTDVREVGSSVPADVFFVADDDESVDTSEIQQRYGHKVIDAVQGTVTEGPDQGEKRLVLYKYNGWGSFSKVTVLELESSYDTTKLPEEQGFEEVKKNDRRYQTYPIVSVLKEPETGR